MHEVLQSILSQQIGYEPQDINRFLAGPTSEAALSAEINFDPDCMLVDVIDWDSSHPVRVQNFPNSQEINHLPTLAVASIGVESWYYQHLANHILDTNLFQKNHPREFSIIPVFKDQALLFFWTIKNYSPSQYQSSPFQRQLSSISCESDLDFITSIQNGNVKIPSSPSLPRAQYCPLDELGITPQFSRQVVMQKQQLLDIQHADYHNTFDRLSSIYGFTERVNQLISSTPPELPITYGALLAVYLYRHGIIDDETIGDTDFQILNLIREERFRQGQENSYVQAINTYSEVLNQLYTQAQDSLNQ